MKERAIILDKEKISNINYLKKFDRIYIGSNSCEHLIPEINDIKYLFSNGLKKITIQTPILTDYFFKKTLIFIEQLSKINNEFEIAINDFGLLNWLNRKYKNISILLSLPVSHDYLRMEKNFLISFIDRYNIKYIETDEEIMVDKMERFKVKLTFHYPYKYLAMSRFCPFEYKISKKCDYSCLNKSYLKLVNSNKKETIYLKNNCYFSKNKIIKSKVVKRLVLNDAN